MGSKFLQLTLLFLLVAAFVAQNCASNQYYANNGTCQNCAANCSTCANALYCLSCNNNFFLVASATNVTCQSCSQIYVGCSACLSNVACTQCITGYFLMNTICVPCAAQNLYCAQCSTDGSTCTLCQYPFFLVNNVCTSQTINDILGKNTTNSTSGNITLPNGTNVAPVYDSNGCNQIQIFYFARCINVIANCVLYQQSGLCQYCAKGYLVTIYGDCTTVNTNLRCEAGYWLNSANNSCVPVSDACDWYYPNNGSCLNCSTGYLFVNNSCVPSIQCNGRQFFYYGTCVNVPSQCITFTSNGTCTSCQLGYNLNSGLCTLSQQYIVNNPCTFPCKTCHFANYSYCFSCQLYYQLVQAQYGSCIPIL